MENEHEVLCDEVLGQRLPRHPKEVVRVHTLSHPLTAGWPGGIPQEKVRQRPAGLGRLLSHD
jgi:hypothetical protein